MDSVKDLIPLIMFLVPGFLAAWIFYSLTSYLKPSVFERIIQALIFTLFTQAISEIVKVTSLTIGKLYSFGPWTNSSSTFTSTLSACFIGVLFSYFANNDKFHAFLRWLNITKETSFPSEWHGTFSVDDGISYIVLHLEDERRLMGWPTEWPADPHDGYFKIDEPEWVHTVPPANLEHLQCILIHVKDVKWVEFMKKE
jgi:hypothetical protein